MVNGWKVTAIIFIVLFILESLLIGWAYNYGTESIENETECSYNICDGYDSYYFDDYENVCYCYIDGEIEHQEYIKK